MGLHQRGEVALLVPDDSLLHITLAKKILVRKTRHFSSGISTAIR